MSDYLMRVLRRAGPAGKAQPLQPFVRSTSPIAERDQRIRMPECDAFGLGESPPAEAASEMGGAEERGETVSSSAPSLLPETRGGRQTRVQRKMAGPAEVPATAPGPSAEKSSRSVPPAFGAAPQMNSEAVTQPAASPSPGPPPGRAETPASSFFLFADESGRQEAFSGREQTEAAVAPPDKAPAARASHADLPPRAGPDRLQPGEVPAHAIRRAAGIDAPAGFDTPSVEPSAWTFTGQQPEPSAGQAAAEEAAEGPRVVIGRIRVEVVPPPDQPAAAASRPGPLTAASVSVIGPLGGGVPSDRRLSLRYR